MRRGLTGKGEVRKGAEKKCKKKNKKEIMLMFASLCEGRVTFMSTTEQLEGDYNAQQFQMIIALTKYLSKKMKFHFSVS